MNDVLFVSLANLMIPKRLRVCLNTKTEVYILDKVRRSYFGAEPRFFTTPKKRKCGDENVTYDQWPGVEKVWFHPLSVISHFLQHLVNGQTWHVHHTCDMSVTIRCCKKCDNSGHSTMRINYLREQIQAGTVRVIFINTEANIADILTKPLPADLHKEFSSVLLHGFGGVPPIASPLFSNEELNRRTFAKMKAARQRQLVARRDKAPSAAALSAIERAMDSSTLSTFRLEP